MAIKTLIADFIGKVPNSLAANPNKAYSLVSATDLTPYEPWAELSQSSYDAIEVSGGTVVQVSGGTTADKHRILLSFDVITRIERNYGTTLWQGSTALEDKIRIAKALITNMICTVRSQAFSVTKIINLSGYNGTDYDTPSSLTITGLSNLTKEIGSDYIDSNGYVHFMLYDNLAGPNQYLTLDYAYLSITLDDVPYTDVTIYIPPSRWVGNTGLPLAIRQSLVDLYNQVGKKQEVLFNKPIVIVRTWKG